jgi:membrane protease YdiL (CAAX protease family)
MTVSERVARRLLNSRAAALAVVYASLAAAAPRVERRITEESRPTMPPAAVALVVAGYPLGRALAGDVLPGPPPDGVAVEILSLGAIVPLAEELIWGGLVERDLGVGLTSLLFALKHGLVDGRWRRAPGLIAFWTGLGLVRRRSPKVARTLHVCANVAGVLLGHAGGRDQF